jgi:hypothetical protein
LLHPFRPAYGLERSAPLNSIERLCVVIGRTKRRGHPLLQTLAILHFTSTPCSGWFLSNDKKAKVAAAPPVGPLARVHAHPRPSAPPLSRFAIVLLIKIRRGQAKTDERQWPWTSLTRVHRQRFRCGGGGGPELPQARVCWLRRADPRRPKTGNRRWPLGLLPGVHHWRIRSTEVVQVIPVLTHF